MREKNSQWIVHQGQKILYENYTGLAGLDLIETLAANDAYTDALGTQTFLLLVNIEGVLASRGAIKAFKESARRSKPHLRRVAVVGAHGLNKFFLEAVSRFSGLAPQHFDTMEEAQDWLVEGSSPAAD